MSSLLRGKGVIVAGLAAIAFGGAIRSARGGRRSFLEHLVFVAILAASGVLLTEAVLRWVPGLLSGAVANAAFSGYHGERDGIYDFDPYTGHILRPSRARPMYWNGHTWRHEANRRGFRGPLVERADAVFLGDSVIYGHGVEDAQTVPARFSDATGLSRANLGLQGSSPVQALELLRRIGLPLRPRYVILCLHPNDVSDSLAAYDDGELARFVREEGYRPAARPPAGLQPVFDGWMRHVALPLLTARVIRAVVARATRAPGPVSRPTEDVIPPAVFEESDLGWAVLRQAVREIQRESRNAGARLVLFDLGYPPRFTATIESLAADVGAGYSDAGRVARTRALAGDDIYLRHDGHWTPAGSEIVARALARAVADPVD